MAEIKTERRKKTEERVLRSYSRGASHAEAKVILKGLSDSSHTKIRAQLVKDGRLSDFEPERRGRNSHRWVPTDELQTMLAANNPVKAERKETGIKIASISPEKLPRSDTSASKLVKEIIESICEIHEQIAHDDAWRKRSEIRRICNLKILPLLSRLNLLAENTEFTFAGTYDYFSNTLTTCVTHWRGVLGRKIDLRGTLAVPAHGSRFELRGGRAFLMKSESCPTIDGMIHPNLLDWMMYLSTVNSDLSRQYQGQPLDYRDLMEAANAINHALETVYKSFYLRIPDKAR